MHPFHHFACGFEIDDSRAIFAEDLSVLQCIFNHHAGADGRHLESPHGVAIAVFMPNKAQGNPAACNGTAQRRNISLSSTDRLCLRKPVPVNAMQTHGEPGIDRCADVRQAVSVAGTREEEVALLLWTHGWFRKEQVFIVAEREVLNSSASVKI